MTTLPRARIAAGARSRRRARAALALAAACACGAPAAEATPSAADAGPAPRATLEGVVLESFEGGALRYAAHAARAEVDLASGDLEAREVRVRWPAAPRGPLELAAPRGRLDLASGRVRLEGGVRGRLGDGERIEGSSLAYEPEPGRIVLEGPVRVTRADAALAGDRLVLEVETSRLRLEGPVRAERTESP